MLLKTTSFARAGLLGNPSDGYFGKTVSFAFAGARADVTLYESPRVQILPNGVDDAVFDDLAGLAKDVRTYGYYGGLRLVKATARVFYDHCLEAGIELPKRCFTVEYTSDIPRLVGLGGSSAICTAVFRALMEFYSVHIPKELVPTLCWRAEHDELGIHCGLQDRVIQVYGGVVFMDFNRGLVESSGHGSYVPLSPSLLPPLYVAYDPDRAEVSGVYHRKLRVLFDDGQNEIVSAMSEFADLAQQGYQALIEGRKEDLPGLINANFDLRDRIFNVSEENRRMVFQAREAGASAKFAGSGGAIVGSYEDALMLERLREKMAEIGCELLTPEIAAAS